ncbi:MAG: hypothetical protein E7069_09905 [Bacteroidales bacterium]|jgi:glycosyltransferase involved in cell wall biosynthesis|nr:hypothetical protein [Bacteroidales bacterium]
MDLQNTYTVCVRCTTFNHHTYIEDAMNGFCMQKTTFPFVCIIIDDLSTDGEQEVLKKYFQEHFNLLENEETNDYVLNFGIHKTNANCYFSIFYLKYNHFSIRKSKVPYYLRWQNSSKYVAICEGDDYWIDENKLQKQVDFLENNKDYSMVFHRAEIVYESPIETSLQCTDIESREYSADELFDKWIVPTASILARREIYNIKSKDRYRPLNGDIIYVLNCAKIGKLRGLSEKMSAYRVQANGVTYDVNLMKSRMLRYPEHFKYIKDNYPFLNQRLVNKKLGIAYGGAVYYDEGIVRKLRDFILACYYSPILILKPFEKLVDIFTQKKKCQKNCA